MIQVHLENSGILYKCFHHRSSMANTNSHKRQLAFLIGNSLESGTSDIVRYSCGCIIPAHL